MDDLSCTTDTDYSYENGKRYNSVVIIQVRTFFSEVAMRMRWIAIALIPLGLISCRLATQMLEQHQSPITTVAAPVVGASTPITATEDLSPQFTETVTASPIIVPQTETAITFSPKNWQRNDETLNIKITVQTPEVQGINAEAASAFNLAAENLISDTLAKTISDFQGMRVDDPGGFVQVTYDVLYSQSTLASIRFTFHVFSGGAHPWSFHPVMTYDFDKMQVLQLGDLFQPGSDYLTVIAKACTAELKTRTDVVFPDFESAAAAKPENYQVWNITPQGLLITFEEYQVAPFAAGPQEVIVPLDKLRPLAAMDGPLAR
jgi:hypothetical protein